MWFFRKYNDTEVQRSNVVLPCVSGNYAGVETSLGHVQYKIICHM